MKKLLAMLLCLSMLVCFCACGDDSASGSAESANATTGEAQVASTEAATTKSTSTTSTTTTTVATTTSATTTLATTTTAATTKSTTKATTKSNSNSNQNSNKSSSGKSSTNTTSATVTKIISAATSTFATVQNAFSPLDRKTPIVITNPNTAPNTAVIPTAPGGNIPTVPVVPTVPGVSTVPVVPTSQAPVTQPTTKQTPVVPTASQKTTIPPAVSKNSVITYPRAAGLTLAQSYSLTANDVPIDLYAISVNNNHSFSSNPKTSTAPVGMFEMTGPVTLKLTVPTAPTSAVVRPTSSGVVPTISGTTVTFTVSKAGYYSVELNGDAKNAVMIFIDEPHTAPSGNVIVKEAGLHDNVSLTVKSGETLYLAPGAVIQGKILVNVADHAKVCGRGIIDGSCFTSWLDSYARLPIELWQSTNVDIEGFFILNPNAWALQVQQSSNVNINNVKVITSRPNGDGFSLQSSHDVDVANCFLRTWDDTLVVKNYGLPTSYNITFSNCTLWNDLAQSMEIGYETNKGKNANPVIHDVTFNNITVLHGFSGAAISIHNGDNADIYNIKYNNIVIEEFTTFTMIDMNNNYSGNWSSVKERGKIHDITINGLTLLSGRFGGKLDASSGPISNIKMSNLNFLGNKVTTASDAKITVTGSVGVTIS